MAPLLGIGPSSGLPVNFHLASYRPSNALRPGDTIGVTIFETGGPSVFSSAPTTQAPAAPSPSGGTPSTIDLSGSSGALSKTTTLPPLTVEADGTVLIPFAGTVRVAGLSPSRAASHIASALAPQLLKPQVLVSYISNSTNLATVSGDANKPGPVTLTLRGERILDVVGEAGGSKWPAPDTRVDIVRGAQRASINLEGVVENPSENVFIRPNDQLYLDHVPRSFTLLGAGQKVSQISFDVDRVSLAEAIARAGGSIDASGNINAIYLFREMPAWLAKRIVDAADPQSLKPSSDVRRELLKAERVKIVYRIDMGIAEGYFLAEQTQIWDKDVILIPEADGTQLVKFFAIVRGPTGIVYDIKRTNN